ncbi:glycoside hydrolase family 25 protein [Bifidobacterium breve]|uniref:glycoside hydrolase family 25 protein n=1 Tax=Bifidobacterium breve TaxID=1685 RepID=UPI000CA11D5C|nr:glycoside hydrolase family 25 protein [Bifidobacterium breve]AUD94222.1 Glycosyl hydrolases family 25 lysozyme [Bifidobacterium breve]
MSAKRMMSAVAVLASMTLVSAVCAAPASALSDVSVDALADASTDPFRTQTISDDTAADAMPDNPDAALPDQVSAAIPDDATVVSEDHAVTADGELKNITTGETVTDPALVGTQDSQPDPLAKTDGESFIPVQADEVKQKVAANGGDANAGAADAQTAPDTPDTQPEQPRPNDSSKYDQPSQPDQSNQSDSPAPSDSGNAFNSGETFDSDEAANSGDVPDSGNTSDSSAATSGTAKATAEGSVRLAALQNNEYGAHWGSYNGTAAFFDASNSLFVQQAKGVIDVSAWQGTIDWQAVKNSGVEGAIIRIAYGWDNGFDNQALRNISECRRLGIPFGVYLYSYAYDANTGAAEGSSLVNLLQKAGVSSSDLGYPVYYDLEKWTWAGHEVPNNPGTYNGIVNAWYSKLKSAGYTNLAVYSYTSYLNKELNSSNIHSKTRWVAQYGSSMEYTAFPTNDRGWQYTSKGRVNGISGTVDLSAFGNKTSTAPVGATGSVYRLYHPGIRVHHYTADAHEMSVLVNQRGWVYEGIMFKTPTSGQPVYRLYHPGIKQHVFTLSQHERNVLSKQRGWIYEGVAWYSNPNGGTAVYRLYNGSNYEHFYTSNRNEYNIRGSQGWTKEGIAWRS